MGSELLSVLQLFFFLILGYAVTRTWIWSRKSAAKALVKKLDDVDQVVEEIQSDDSPTSKKKAGARFSNAQERKKSKKPKEVGVEKLKTELHVAPAAEPVAVVKQPPEQQPEQPPKECPPPQPEKVAVSEEAPQDAPEDAPVEEAPQEPPQEEPEEVPQEVSERVAKMLAKKMERKAKKALERKLSEEKEKSQEEEKSHCVAGGQVEEPVIVATVEAKSDAEAQSDDMAQTTSTPSMVPALGEPQAEELTIESVQNDAIPTEKVPAIQVSPIEEVHEAKESSDALDNMETTSDGASDGAYVRSNEGISTPEQCLTPRGPSGEPIAEPMMWCGMPQVPPIQGWMAVAVPAEMAPPGAPGPFDGLWQNGDDERIVIDHEEILFEGGMKWVMEMKSLTNLSVQVGEEEFTAELDAANQKLVWSDGDVWTCVGQTDAQQKWAAQREADGMPCVFVDGEQFLQMGAMPMPAPLPVPQNMVVPQDAKSWETCWDWSKKGWCPRGADCEWYHPPQPLSQFSPCKPCGEAAAPFSEFMDTPFGGPAF